MPRRPTRACPICRKVGCSVDKHSLPKRPSEPWDTETTAQRRPAYYSYREQKRRREFVQSWLAQYGPWCPDCQHFEYHPDGEPVVIWADHVAPVGVGGWEEGPLRASCSRCQRKQAGRIGNKVKAQRRL